MKTSRLLAISTAALIVGASVFANGAAAQADDFYVVAGDLSAVETDPYPAGWFRGDVTGTPGTYTSDAAGLTVTGGQFQLLNGSPAATDLTAVNPGITLSSGTASFQIPIFTTPGAGYTTLYADPASIALGAWYTTNTVGPFTAGSAHLLSEYQTAFPTLEILAFGFNKIAGSTASIASLDWNGDTYWFLPVPTATLSVSTITPAALASTGTTLTVSGLIPGESVGFGISYGQSGDPIGSGVADANGVASFTYIAAAGDPALTPGSYSLLGFGDTSGAIAFAALTVTALLPAAGTDSILPVAAGGVLLLGGAIALILVSRRRAALGV